MKQFAVKSLLAIGLALALWAFVDNRPDEPAPPSLKGKKVLFTYGGWDGHQPVKFVGLLLPWLQSEGAQVDTSRSLAPYADSLYMETVDLVIQIHTMSKISKEEAKGLMRAVKEGGTGIAGWHGGLCDAFRQNTQYQFMTGGQWVAHPGGGKVSYKVNITDHDDPVTKGLNDFNVLSEQYYMHVDPNVKVLATTTFTGEHAWWIDKATMPITWKKMYGKGRVFFTSLGHNTDVYDIPEAYEMLKRGMRWASESRHHPAEPWVSPIYP